MSIIKKSLKEILLLILDLLLLILDLPLIVLSFIVRKDPELYVFTSNIGDKFNDSSKYLYFYFKEKGKKVCYCCSNKKLAKKLQERGINAVYSFSIEGIKIISKAKYIFITHNVRGVLRSLIGALIANLNIIQTWHGVGFKSIELLDRNYSFISRIILRMIDSRFKAILATSKPIKEKFEKSFNSKKVFITGLPRNDVLFNPKLLFSDYKKELGLGRFNKIILYAPTFRDSQYFFPFTEDFLEKFDEWLKKVNYVFLVKKHNFDQALNIPQKYERILDISDRVEDVQELLIHVDVLISDYSSVITDFALLRRPIILYIYDIKRYLEECRDFYFDPREVFPGPFAYSQEEIIKLLENLDWFEDPEYKNKFEKFLDFFHEYKDGKSCERVEKLLEVL